MTPKSMKILGTPLLIEWHKFKPGTSFFVPCLDRRSVQVFVLREARRLKLDVTCRYVIENNVYGVRVWRNEVILPPHSASPKEV